MNYNHYTNNDGTLVWLKNTLKWEVVYNKGYYKFNNQVLSYESVIEKLGLIPLSERAECFTNKLALKTFKQSIHKEMFREKENVI